MTPCRPFLRLRCLRLRLPPVCPRASLPRCADILHRGPGSWVSRDPTPALSSAETTGPPRFLEGPSWTYAVLSDPGRTPRARPLRHGSAVAPSIHGDGPDNPKPFEAPSHGLSPRCLRFAGALTNDHARLACGWWPASTAQDSHLLGPLRKVSALSALAYIASSSPRLTLAHG